MNAEFRCDSRDDRKTYFGQLRTPSICCGMESSRMAAAYWEVLGSIEAARAMVFEPVEA